MSVSRLSHEGRYTKSLSFIHLFGMALVLQGTSEITMDDVLRVQVIDPYFSCPDVAKLAGPT